MRIEQKQIEIKPAVPAVVETQYNLTVTRAELEAVFGALNESCVLDIKEGLSAHKFGTVNDDALSAGMLSVWGAIRNELERELKQNYVRKTDYNSYVGKDPWQY